MDVTLQRLRSPVRFAMTAVGGAISAIGLELFLTPHSLIAGGATGASLLISHMTGIHLGLLLLTCNLILFLAGFKRWSARGRWSALIGLAALSLSVHALRPFPAVIDEPLPAAFAGGMLLGLGFGIAIRSGGFGDVLHEAPKLLPEVQRMFAWWVVWIGNVLLLAAIGYLSDWQAALHSAIALVAMYSAATWSIDRFSVTYVAVIQSRQRDIIQTAVAESFGQQALLPYTNDPERFADATLLVTCHRTEWHTLKALVRNLDPHAEMFRYR